MCGVRSDVKVRYKDTGHKNEAPCTRICGLSIKLPLVSCPTRVLHKTRYSRKRHLTPPTSTKRRSGPRANCLETLAFGYIQGRGQRRIAHKPIARREAHFSREVVHGHRSAHECGDWVVAWLRILCFCRRRRWRCWSCSSCSWCCWGSESPGTPWTCSGGLCAFPLC